MKVKILPSKTSGEVSAPPSKSFAHRYLIGSVLSCGKCVIKNIADSDDISATLSCIEQLGGSVTKDGNIVTVIPTNEKQIENAVFDCKESGSTLRFFIPVVLATGAKNCTFLGSERLLARGIKEYEKLFENSDVTIKSDEKSIEVNGTLSAGNYEISGEVSSQYTTGMLFALSVLDGKSTLKITGNAESRAYVDMTIKVLKDFGADIAEPEKNFFEINGKGRLSPGEFTVEGDWSNAAFLIALSRLAGTISVSGLNENSVQGDKICIEAFETLDGENAEIDLKDCPDLAPILFTYAAYKNGGKFINTRRLRVKESDRANVMAEELKKFGANVKVYENSVEIEKTQLKPPIVPLCGHNDHRIVMALSVLAAVFGAEIDGAEAVNKSYPDFFRDIKKAGVNVYEIR
ncbi:MAG: 3-phosphoshikimate 1-carboxyvinyltransferase [Clostridiales bacterium]|nr:3-phosphoshikimate 1-carboxyvinyltransferase [Clostridiales bacterium]MDY2721558.1 3-phosphoshikimate 1-carboxyvinyltransferase [Eubacteriales bacterium]